MGREDLRRYAISSSFLFVVRVYSERAKIQAKSATAFICPSVSVLLCGLSLSAVRGLTP
jgi:hypothetical protein